MYFDEYFEKALLADGEDQISYMTFSIVGAGPTGVELAGALAELKNHILPADYPDLNIEKMRILLTLTFILSFHLGFSQKTLTLIIDTIDFVDDYDKYDFNIFLTHQGFANLGETDSSAIISTDRFPNFQTVVTLKSDSTSIQLPIDRKYGYLELSNIYESDTIRINYLKQYREGCRTNCRCKCARRSCFRPKHTHYKDDHDPWCKEPRELLYILECLFKFTE